MGGLGEYLDIDPSLFRTVYTGLIVFTGIVPGIAVYFLVSILIPKKPEVIYEKAL